MQHVALKAVAIGGIAACLFATMPSKSAQLSGADTAVPQSQPAREGVDPHEAMLKRYCSGCHNDRLKTGGMSVQVLDVNDLTAHLPTWEKILRRLSLGEMPPRGMPRPAKEQISEFTTWLSDDLDANAIAHPDPGRIVIHRLNRVQYANAVRDLLDLDVDISGELPVDDTGYGFDDIADLLTVSSTLVERYVAVAGKVSRLATGIASRKAVTLDHKIDKDPQVLGFGIPSYNERASDSLPLGSRGGGVYKFYAPYDANYTIELYLNPGTVTERETNADNRVEFNFPLKAGPHLIGASFRKALELDEHLLPARALGPRPGKPKGTPVPLRLDVQIDGAPVKRLAVPSFATGPEVVQGFFLRDVVQISVAGPYNITGPGDTPSRRRIFICHPSPSLPERVCAHKILASLAHRAFRRPVSNEDLKPLLKIYAAGRKKGGFDAGIEAALEAILVAPDFLLVRQSEPQKIAPGATYAISDLDLATRLSLFLWSSIPDQELLKAAESGNLHKPEELRGQVTRMLRDPKAHALTEQFATQWLYLNRLDAQRPDHQEFPDFSQPLRSAMRKETELFFSNLVKENGSVLDLLDADYTYLNERLAKHYGLKGVHGETFRRVGLDQTAHRGGLLGQSGILTVTSYNNRTSVVLRGKWILENILGAPPPPPPPNVPALNDKKDGGLLTIREQMELHRKNPVCASCHSKMDPLGFSLENFDAVGAWRDEDAGKPLDVSAVLPDGTKFSGPDGLMSILMSRKEQFVDTFIQKLMTYALGRGIEAQDMPAVRKIRYTTAKDNYPMQDIIFGIIRSVPFSMGKVAPR